MVYIACYTAPFFYIIDLNDEFNGGNMSYSKILICFTITVVLAGCGSAQVKNESAESDRTGADAAEVDQALHSDPVQALEQTDTLGTEVDAKAEATPVVEEEVVTATHAAADMDHEVESEAIEPVSLENLPENTHVISLLKKTEKHPFFGVGDKTGFVLDGQEGLELVLERGKTYRFIIRSTPMHDVYISSDEMGWGAKVVEDGVEGNFTYEGELVITPNEKTPDILYYQCQNHKAMGARFFVVDQGDQRTVAELIEAHGVLNDGGAISVGSQVSDAEVKQKLSYASLVFMSKPAKRVLASDNAKAKELLEVSRGKLADARSLHEKGDNNAAMSLIDDALRNMSLASQMVPSEGRKEEQKQRYAEALDHLQQQRVSHAEAVERMSSMGEESIAYDEAAVESYKAAALGFVEKGEYGKALVSIQDADKLVTLAINEMLDSQTVKYELNLDTPEGEYEYEHNRYLGYAELIPVAIEEKKPSKGQLSLLEGFVNKGEAMSKKAEEMASENNYPDAIRLMQEATKQVRRALRMLGIKQ